MTELRGVGIGLGVAQGPVERMSEALPAPENTPSTQGANWRWRLAQSLPAALAGHIAALTTLYERVPKAL